MRELVAWATLLAAACFLTRSAFDAFGDGPAFWEGYFRGFVLLALAQLLKGGRPPAVPVEQLDDDDFGSTVP